MAIIQTVEEQLARLGSFNRIYNYNRTQWKYLLQSYLGGDDYRRGNNLIKYQLETDQDYSNRLAATPCPNHCKSIVSVYNSFLFRQQPDRDFGSLDPVSELADFLADADRDGRDLDSFLKEAMTWASVFGHCWIMVTKPNLGAQTRADEIELDVRPYVTLVNPLAVLDWRWTRTANGSYELKYLKYVEEIDGSVQTIKEWTPETIETWIVDFDTRIMQNHETETNGLGRIPAVILYNTRSSVRGLGVSDIADIADQQRLIYNLTSEAEQTIRMDSHPSLVKTPETQAGAGAGSIIHMPENLDPALKPYLLQYGGASVDAIYRSIEHAEQLIDKLANTGGVRNVSNSGMSGIALTVEFQLLSAKIAEKASNLELAEQQIWRLFAEYLGFEWDGSVEYADNFAISAADEEYTKLQMARSIASTPAAQQQIDTLLLQLLNQDMSFPLGPDESETALSREGEYYGIDPDAQATSTAEEMSETDSEPAPARQAPVQTPDVIANTPDVSPGFQRNAQPDQAMIQSRIDRAQTNRLGK